MILSISIVVRRRAGQRKNRVGDKAMYKALHILSRPPKSRMLKHGDFSPQDDHRNDQPDRDGRPDDAEYPDVDRVVGRAEFAGGPFEESHALAEDEVDHWLSQQWCGAVCDVM